MTADAVTIAVVLAALGLVDGAFSGFRARLGHDGLVDHRATDRRGAMRGAAAALLALAPPAVVAGVAVAAGGAHLDAMIAGGRAMLTVLGPYGAVMALALVAYWLAPWRQRFLASSLLLGPLSLVRPLVVVAAVVVVAADGREALPTLVAALAAAGILAIEPVLTRQHARGLGPPSAS